MTYIFTVDGTANDSVNLAITDGAAAMFNLKQLLKQAGWLVKSSSDGTTFSSSGDQITTGTTGAGGMNNTNAWYRIQDPAAAHEFTAQRTTAATTWRIKLSHSAHFTGGSPGATQTPSATDEGVVLGSGTDAAPTGAALFGTFTKFHCGADNAAPYDFWAAAQPSGGGVGVARIGQFTMVTGSFPSADVAPYIFCAANSTFAASATFGLGYFKKGLSGETFVGFSTAAYNDSNNSTQIPNTLGANPYTGNDGGYPIPILRPGAGTQPGWKGMLNMSSIAWKGNARNSGSDFEDVSGGSSRYIVLDNMLLRWPVGVLPSP